MLTARGDVMDRVVGLEIGADDYLPKPFEPRELLAAPADRAAARARAGRSRGALAFDGIEIDLERRQVLRMGSAVELTGTEFELLALLASEPQKVFSRDDILNRLRGHEAELYTRAVDILVSRLRKKLEPLDCIKTLRNAGYAFCGRALECRRHAAEPRTGGVAWRRWRPFARWARAWSGCSCCSPSAWS